jgi:hypothetical protein
MSHVPEKRQTRSVPTARSEHHTTVPHLAMLSAMVLVTTAGCSSPTTPASGGPKTWPRFIDMRAPAVTQNVDGDILLAGLHGLVTGGPDSLCVKLSPNGSDVWSKFFEAGQLQALAADKAGSIFVAGHSYLGAGLVVRRLSADGGEVWSRSYGDVSTNAPLALAMDAAGDVVLAGVFFVSIDSKNGGIQTKGDEDAFVGKVDQNTGEWIWLRQIGDVGIQEAHDVTVDEGGDILVVGEFQGTIAADGYAVTDAGQGDAFLLRLDATGKAKGLDRFGDAATIDAGLRVEALPDGDVVLAGAFRGTINLGGEDLSTTNPSTFVTRRKADGTHVWSQAILGVNKLTSLAVDGAGEIIVGGVFIESLLVGAQTTTSQGKTDSYMLAYDAGGNLVWLKSFGSSEEDWQDNAFPLASSKGILHVGVAGGPVDFGEGDVHCVGDGPPCALLGVVTR